MITTKLKIVAGLILCSAIFGGGYKVAEWRYSAIIADINTQLSEGARLAEKAAKEHANTVVTKAEVVKAEREVVYKTITKELIKYVQDPSAGKCVVSDEWVRIHDAAASPRLPDSSP
jgi:hypothetical protein